MWCFCWCCGLFGVIFGAWWVCDFVVLVVVGCLVGWFVGGGGWVVVGVDGCGGGWCCGWVFYGVVCWGGGMGWDGRLWCEVKVEGVLGACWWMAGCGVWSWLVVWCCGG